MSETIEVTQDTVFTELMLVADPETGVVNGGHLRSVTRLIHEGEVMHVIPRPLEAIAGALQPGHGFEEFVSMVDQQLAATVVTQSEQITALQAENEQLKQQLADLSGSPEGSE